MKKDLDTLLDNFTPRTKEEEIKFNKIKEILPILPTGNDNYFIWILGGFPRRLLMNETIETCDIDYFADCNGCKSKLINKLKTLGAKEIKTTKFAKTFELETIPIQVITRNYNNITSVFSDFDFSVCCVELNLKSRFVRCQPAVYSDLKNKILRFSKTRTNPTTFTRFAKYLKEGYRVEESDLLSMLSDFVLHGKTSLKKSTKIIFSEVGMGLY